MSDQSAPQCPAMPEIARLRREAERSLGDLLAGPRNFLLLKAWMTAFRERIGNVADRFAPEVKPTAVLQPADAASVAAIIDGTCDLAPTAHGLDLAYSLIRLTALAEPHKVDPQVAAQIRRLFKLAGLHRAEMVQQVKEWCRLQLEYD